MTLILGFLDGLRPEPRFTVSQWADKHRHLNPSASSEPGQWRTSRVPYLKEIMDKLSSYDPTQEVIVMKGAQLGLTEAGNNWIGYVIDVSPGPMLMVMPTEPTVKRNSKIRIDPMIEHTPRLNEKVKSARERDSGNTVLQKSFPGGNLIMAGANSAAGLRSMPVSKLFLDEVDAYPGDLDGEGSPIDLAMARTRTFPKKKVYKISTPTIEGISVIEKEFQATDQRYYHVPCPHCYAEQVLNLSRLKVTQRGTDGKPLTTVYLCVHCNEEIEERQKNFMLSHGSWVAMCPENATFRKAGYHISSLYSPFGWYSWNDTYREYEEALADETKMKTFVNTVLGETFKESGEVPDWKNLYNRRESYTIGMVPDIVSFLTCGVDIQIDRIEASVYGWYEGKKSYLIEHFVLMGRTDRPEVWNNLRDNVVSQMFMRENGTLMKIIMTAVDTGYNTAYVYDFCRMFDQSCVVPIKGQANQNTILTPPRQIDIKSDGKKTGSIGLYNIGVSVLKSEFYGYLKLEIEEDMPEPNGYCHFPQCDAHFFKGLTSEQLQFKIDTKGFKSYEWVKKYDKNEPLDCRNYARAAAAIVGMDRMTDEHYKKERDKYEKKPEVPEQKQSERRKSSWL